MSTPTDPGAQAAAVLAADLVENGARVGLGSGRAASAFIARLGERAGAGLSIACVASSQASARQARSLGLELMELAEDLELDLTVDGADEVAPNLDLVKGRGGAFVRERIVAAASRRQVIIVGPDKLVAALGESGAIPVEIIPMSLGPCLRRLKQIGVQPELRPGADRTQPFVTDNGNLIVDVKLATTLADTAAARAFDAEVLSIPGVVDTGLFLGTAETVLVGYPDGRVDTRTRQH